MKMPNRYGIIYKVDGQFVLKVYETSSSMVCDDLVCVKKFNTREELDEYTKKQWYSVREPRV
jgi:hypothetical protein